MSTVPPVILCRCRHAGAIPPETVASVEQGLRDAGAAFQAVDDLCLLSAEGDGRLAQWAESGARVVACAPRAVRSLLSAAGAELPASRVLDARRMCPCGLLRELGVEVDAAPPAEPLPPDAPADWMPWFPVIDPERCTHCNQCLSFCLFGVYALDADGRVAVAQPRNCKTHCPACARVCPQGAILFPKHPTGPINGEPADGDGGPTKVDLAEVLTEDVYAVLRARGQQLADPQALQQALAERARCACSGGADAPGPPPPGKG